MKTTELLMRHHREVERLFARIGRSRGAEKRNLVIELAAKLAAHMRVEEELVYPVSMRVDEDGTKEALEEHTVVAFELRRLAATGVDDSMADAKLTLMEELVRHHVIEEETSLFPELDRRLTDEGDAILSARCRARFEEIVESGYGAELFKKSRKTRRSGRELRA